MRIFFGILTLLLVGRGFGCCTAWRSDGELVQIADQEVLIVWDAEKKVQHFVRRANFESVEEPEDFGFLVPTPTRPQLGEVSEKVFWDLGELIKPEVKTKEETEVSFAPFIANLFKGVSEESLKGLISSRAEGVQLLDRALIGEFEVSVIQASDPDALVDWLEKNDYGVRPQIKEWVKPYLEKAWILTVFKYRADRENVADSLMPASVCLSFSTEQPFFPYRVSSDVLVEPEEGSLLRVYFVGSERVSGMFEGGGEKKWEAPVKYSNENEKVGAILKGQIKGGVAGVGQWLTVFEDGTWPGGSEDLYFESLPEAEVVIPPPTIRTQARILWFPLDLILVSLGLVWIVVRKFSRKEKEAVS